VAQTARLGSEAPPVRERRRVADADPLARAIRHIGSIDPDLCRATAAKRHDMRISAAGYERVFRSVLANRRAAA
jgi:hypothetical protein